MARRRPPTIRQMLNERIDGIRYQDWIVLAQLLLEREHALEHSDDVEGVLRSIARDARLADAGRLERRHFRLAMRLVQIGRVHESRRSS